jgi:hypothetical protein
MYKKGTLFGKPKSQVVKHPGAFRAAAQAHNESTQQYAEENAHAPGTLGKRARLALAFSKMRKK